MNAGPAGARCAEVALAVGVARQTLYTWKKLLDERGIDPLRGVPERGRPAQLDEQQLAALRAAILQKPIEHGFGTELWTLKRVGAVIESLHGVRYSQTQVWRILGSMGLSPQKPDKRAIERNEDAVRSWSRSTWPALKKSPARRPSNGLCRQVRTQRTPHPGAYFGAQGTDARFSVPFQLKSRLGHCGLTRTNCMFRLHEGSIKKEEIVDFLKALKARLKQPRLVIWDGLKAHRSRLVRSYLDSLNGHIQIASLSPYAPDLNPVEYLWAWLKRHAMANYCPNNLSELHTSARKRLKSTQKRPSIIAACWMQAALW